MHMFVARTAHQLHFNGTPLRTAIHGDNEGPQVLWTWGQAQVKAAPEQVERGRRTAARGFVLGGRASVTRQEEGLSVDPANTIKPHRGAIVHKVNVFEL